MNCWEDGRGLATGEASSVALLKKLLRGCPPFGSAGRGTGAMKGRWPPGCRSERLVEEQPALVRDARGDPLGPHAVASRAKASRAREVDGERRVDPSEEPTRVVLARVVTARHDGDAGLDGHRAVEDEVGERRRTRGRTRRGRPASRHDVLDARPSARTTRVRDRAVATRPRASQRASLRLFGSFAVHHEQAISSEESSRMRHMYASSPWPAA